MDSSHPLHDQRTDLNVIHRPNSYIKANTSRSLMAASQGSVKQRGDVFETKQSTGQSKPFKVDVNVKITPKPKTKNLG